MRNGEVDTIVVFMASWSHYRVTRHNYGWCWASLAMALLTGRGASGFEGWRVLLLVTFIVVAGGISLFIVVTVIVFVFGFFVVVVVPFG